MKNKSILLIASFILNAGIASAKEVKGQVEITYDTLLPAQLGGSYCNDDAECWAFAETCQSTYGFMLGSKAKIDYDIVTEAAIHRAYYTYTTYSSEQIPMSALGIAGKYGFISRTLPDGFRNDLGIKNIFFLIDKNFTSFTSQFLFTIDTKIQNQKYQCILSGKRQS